MNNSYYDKYLYILQNADNNNDCISNIFEVIHDRIQAKAFNNILRYRMIMRYATRCITECSKQFDSSSI